MRGWAGVDIGAHSSVLAVVDDHGEVLARLQVDMDLTGQRELLTELSAIARRRRDLLPVAVEDPGALITRALIDARFPVIAVHPLAVARFRGGHSPAGPKSDRSDALTPGEPDPASARGAPSRAARQPSDAGLASAGTAVPDQAPAARGTGHAAACSGVTVLSGSCPRPDSPAAS